VTVVGGPSGASLVQLTRQVGAAD